MIIAADAATQVKVGSNFLVVTVPDKRNRGVGANKHELEGENCVEHVVHLGHNVTDLLWRLLSIHHDLGFVADVYDDTDAIGDITEVAASQKEVLNAIGALVFDVLTCSLQLSY